MDYQNYSGITPILELLEDNIDLQHCAEAEKLHTDAMCFLPVDRLPLSIEYPADKQFADIPYVDAFTDPEKMLYRELVSIENNVWNSVRLGDDYPLQIRPNYGIGIIPSLFGAEIKLTNCMPWVIPIEEPEKFRKIVSRGVPDVHGGLAGMIAEAYQCFQELLKPFPKCSKAIHITHPDMQGPFDNLHLIRGNELFYELYDEPELVHEAMELVTETMIAYQKTLPDLNDNAGPNLRYIHRAIYCGTVLLKLDTEAAMISGTMYQEFCEPYNRKILDVFGGGGAIHFCGGEKAWPAEYFPRLPIRCLNFGNPEMQDILTTWNHSLEMGICVVGYGDGQPYSFLHDKMQSGLHTGVTLLTRTDSFEHAREILELHRDTFRIKC